MNVFDISINLSRCSRDCNVINRVIIYNIRTFFFSLYINRPFQSHRKTSQESNVNISDIKIGIFPFFIFTNFQPILLRNIPDIPHFNPTWFAKDKLVFEDERGGKKGKKKK